MLVQYCVFLFLDMLSCTENFLEGANCWKNVFFMSDVLSYNHFGSGPKLMDTDIHVFSLWEDHVVSQEKGRRVVHYYLRIPQGSKFKPHAMCCLRGLFGCFWAHKYHEFRHKVACKKRGSGMAGVFDFKASLITIYFNSVFPAQAEFSCASGFKLECRVEWIPSYKVAVSDKLGMRCTGRLTVRPQPQEDSSDYSFELGAAVDAWWSNGWWEGVVTGFDVTGSGHLQVYFPGENILLEIQRKNRVDDKWVEVKGKIDIKWFISSSLKDVSKCSIKEPDNCEKQMAPKLVLREDNKMASTCKHSTEKQDTDVLKLKKRRCIDFLADSHVFSSWEEHVVSQGKGRRVVHYYLKDTSGELILAVVGTEGSSRNMLYVVSEDYLDAFGHTSTINSDTKWRTRKGVVEWLTILISKHHQSPPISNTPRRETRRSALMAGHISDDVSKKITQEDPSMQGPSGSRSVGESDHSGIRKSIPGNQIAQAKSPTYPKLKIKYPNIEPVGIQLVEPRYKRSFDVGDNIEVLCNDSGMKGCWFRCKVLQVSQKRMEVQYNDIQDCESLEKLEEWIPSYKVAVSDKLGMRCTGRLTVRPQPMEDSSDCSFELGAAVDAWWSDGWWEGVVTGFDVSGSDHLQVYFPGENILLEIQRKNVRTSRDWVDDKWIEVERKKDIKSFIGSSLTHASRCSINEPENCENQMTPRLMAPEDNKMASTSKDSAEKQDTDVLKLKRRWYIDFLADNKN
ncbi:hypothetical protein KY289_009501 [Solanum tuberosum]|nr:hypothetical protein KY289_009501 [Solanum tuberosum]